MNYSRARIYRRRRHSRRNGRMPRDLYDRARHSPGNMAAAAIKHDKISPDESFLVTRCLLLARNDLEARLCNLYIYTYTRIYDTDGYNT